MKVNITNIETMLCQSGLGLFLISCLLCQGGQMIRANGSDQHIPIGIYSVQSTDELKIIADAGFNTVSGPADEAFLDAAQEHGLKVLASPGTHAGQHFNQSKVRSKVLAFDSHPALWSWYIIDEPDLNLVSPAEVRAANEFYKLSGAQKPTSVVLFYGSSSASFGDIPDQILVDRYPVAWMPISNFGQHVRDARLGTPKITPVTAIVQAFDWSRYYELVPGETDLREPTYEEIRNMTFDAITLGSRGIFYFAFHTSKWNIQEYPETWKGLKRVVNEVNEVMPLFTAERPWWPKYHVVSDREKRWNESLEFSVRSTWLRVKKNSQTMPAGDYILAVNTTRESLVYQFKLPVEAHDDIPVYGSEDRIQLNGNLATDLMGPLAVRIYGPLRSQLKMNSSP